MCCEEVEEGYVGLGAEMCGQVSDGKEFGDVTRKLVQLFQCSEAFNNLEASARAACSRCAAVVVWGKTAIEA